MEHYRKSHEARNLKTWNNSGVSNMDIELARLVAEDLDYLFNEWNQDIDDASLRRSSPVLRSLLVEGLLARAAMRADRDIRIMAPAIGRAITESELRECSFFQAGGAKYKGMIVQSASMIPRAMTPAEVKASYERTKDVIGKSYPVKIGIFLKQTSFVVKGVLINREEVIKYVANKLGGAHYDPSRSATKKGNEISLEEKYSLLDEVNGGMFTADKNAIYYELLSIGQRVVNSRDIRQLRKHLTQVLSVPPVIPL